jgi:hypothetical protein
MIPDIIAAPIAARLVKVIPAHLLGTLIGGIIILTNIRTLLVTLDVSHTINLFTYVVLSIFGVFALINESMKTEDKKVNHTLDFNKKGNSLYFKYITKRIIHKLEILSANLDSLALKSDLDVVHFNCSNYSQHNQ